VPIPKYRSKFEAYTISALERNKGFEVEYETEKWKYTIPASDHTYTPDVKIIFPSGHERFVELKGKLDIPTRKKMVLIREQYPDKDIRILFMRNNKLTKTSKTTYMEWAAKVGYISAVGTIPKSWLVE